MLTLSSVRVMFSAMFKLLMLVALLGACQTTDRDKAQRSAEEYIKHIPNAADVLCADTDTDGDGYVSCTVFVKNDEPMQIQCGSERICIWNCASGCKYEPSFKMTGKTGGYRRPANEE